MQNYNQELLEFEKNLKNKQKKQEADEIKAQEQYEKDKIKAQAEYNRQLGFEQFRTNLENANRARDLQVAGINADILAKNASLRGDYANRQLAIDNATSAVISGNIDAAKQSLAGLARQATYADWVKMMQENDVLVGPDGSMVKLKKEAKNGGKIKRRRRLS
jgi:hypothetical protein